MTGSRLIDSSVWLSYFLNEDFKDIIENEDLLLLSALSLFEIKRKLAKNNIPSAKISKSIDFIKKRSLVILVTAEIAEKASEVALEHDLPVVDSLIYSTSLLHSSVLYTLDNDFRKLKDAVVL